MRRILKEYAVRGKLDVYVGYEDHRLAGTSLQYNAVLAEQYVRCAKEAEEAFSIPNDLTVSRLMNFPDVLKMEEEEADESALWEGLETALREAAGNLKDARKTEGTALKADLCEKLSEMDTLVDEVIQHEPAIMETYKERLREKVGELLDNTQIDENRIASEVVIYADKICTDEETVRLKSHIRQMREALQAGDGIGRKLDFLAQEMNREANTVLSKAGDILTSDLGVALKTVIEKIREQIQNIE